MSCQHSKTDYHSIALKIKSNVHALLTYVSQRYALVYLSISLSAALLATERAAACALQPCHRYTWRLGTPTNTRLERERRLACRQSTSTSDASASASPRTQNSLQSSEGGRGHDEEGGGGGGGVGDVKGVCRCRDVAAHLFCHRLPLYCPCGRSGLPGRAAGSTEALCLLSPEPRRDNQDTLVEMVLSFKRWRTV